MVVLNVFGKSIFIICLPVFLIAGTIYSVANQVSLYDNGFEKYNVAKKTGMHPEELYHVAIEMINYYGSEDELFELKVVIDGETVDLFNEREILHLKDVRGLIRLCRNLLWGTLGYIFLYIAIGFLRFRGKFLREMERLIAIGSGTTLGVITILGLSSYFGFESVFLRFHLAFFNNDLWILNPDDRMLMMFPQSFFYDAALIVAAVILLEAVFLGGFSIYLLSRRQ